MNVLVTGSDGQLGNEIRENITDKNKWFFYPHQQLDILDEKQIARVLLDNNINVVVNCAAYTNFDGCKLDEQRAYEINALGPENLAKALAKRNGILLHVSSDYVFDGKKRWGKYKPSDVPNPISVYGKSKNLGDQKIKQTNCKYLIFRVSWLYGGKVKKNFVKTIFEKLENEDTFGVVNDQTGTPTYVKDFAKFIVEILDKFTIQELKDRCGIYHFANKGKTTWYHLSKQIKKYKNKYEPYFRSSCKIKKLKTSDYPSMDTRPTYSPLSIKKTERVFEYLGRNWKKALKECIIKYIKEK